MKKLILLINILLLSWSSFSQQDTAKDSIVFLKVPVAKLVIKDLIEGDGNKEELKEVSRVLELTQEKITLKDKELSTLNLKIQNLELVVKTKDEQFSLQEELSKKLQKELKVEKTKSFLYKIGAGVGAVATVLLLLQK
jgi:septal ring factor EnvC (AmiA/AmiB activator)